MTEAAPEKTADPCRCLKSFAYVTGFHPGHCCFWPTTQDCHPAEVAAWEAERDRRSERRPYP